MFIGNIDHKVEEVSEQIFLFILDNPISHKMTVLPRGSEWASRHGSIAMAGGNRITRRKPVMLVRVKLGNTPSTYHQVILIKQLHGAGVEPQATNKTRGGDFRNTRQLRDPAFSSKVPTMGNTIQWYRILGSTAPKTLILRYSRASVLPKSSVC